MRGDGDILLVSTFSLGQAPLGIAWPAAFLREAGFSPKMLDLSVEPIDAARVRGARLIAFHVPMHTATRLALEALPRFRELSPAASICFFGHYAHLHQDYLRGVGVDHALGGEVEEALVAIARELESPGAEPDRAPEAGSVLRRLAFVPPHRDGLPPLDRYLRLEHHGEKRLVGYVESTRGCKHVCRHCPITPVYGGRFFAVPEEIVLADVERLVRDGAEHVTFGDPDFLNGPTHALRIARGLAERHPGVTFDFTAKVEHLLRHRALLPELRSRGCLFIVSAFESLSDDTLERLRKGHCRTDLERVVRLGRSLSLPIRSTWVPFTPWSSRADVADIFSFIDGEDLVDTVDPVQLSIRLLVPRGSALLDLPDAEDWFLAPGDDPLTRSWSHPDPAMDTLQRDLAAIVEDAGDSATEPRAIFERLWRRASESLPMLVRSPSTLSRRGARRKGQRPPRLTETWFC